MSRLVPGRNWIKGWQFWMQESEAPDSYIIWSAISALAGATQRQVFLRWVYHSYFANMYIIFVGPAGIVHKSSTIDMVRQFLREIDIPMASEGMTKEAFIKQMITRGGDHSTSITALPDEFSDFIRPSGGPMVEFLTSIYGCPSAWEYTTRAHGTETITNAFVNLLAGTTPTWIANEFDVTFTEQGFASRTLFVHETDPRFRKAKVIITEDMYRMRKLLIEDLLHISQQKGEFQWENDEAFDWFADWYDNKLVNELAGVDYRLKGYLARKPTHALKLAMILQLAESDDLFITLDNIRLAKSLLDGLEQSMAKTFSAVGRNIYASDYERIYEEIIQAGGTMTLQDITRRNFSALDKAALQDALDTLIQTGLVSKRLEHGTIIYTSHARDA